ncbi:putative polygalacturonase QRT2-like [Capsicum annuum]|nr:putative polygalacturonase QRT2-like [Capsicum annuum]
MVRNARHSQALVRVVTLSVLMSFMDQDESWSLLKSAAFANEALPYEFETVGKQIAEKYHGLPLTIVVVGGLLKSKRAVDYWESVAKDVKSFVTNDPYIRCSHVLWLSYNHLTRNLKTCLLYFGFFPENTEIPVKHLMRLWMADGFLNLEKDLEGEAEKCLQDLIDRCLVLVSKKSRDETEIRSYKILSLIWLRYLALRCIVNLDIPPEICRLWNLQTFIVKGFRQSVITFPEEIWGLTQLRHLKVGIHFYLPNPPSRSVEHEGFSNVKTLSFLSPHCFTVEGISGIHYVKKLGIHGDGNDYGGVQNSGLFNNLVHLHQLETLSLKGTSIWSSGILPASISSAKAFPATLKKLKLERTFLSWLYLDIIAEMPNLEKDTNDNFPVLERLMIRSCHHLKEMPIEFADINTLQLIQLKWCLPELGKSAAHIQKEQEDLGNNPVDVRISDPFTDDDDDGVVPDDDDNHSEDSDANAAEDDDN